MNGRRGQLLLVNKQCALYSLGTTGFTPGRLHPTAFLMPPYCISLLQLQEICEFLASFSCSMSMFPLTGAI